MKVNELVQVLNWDNLTPEVSLDKEVTGVYCGDLLSWVMGNGLPEQAWITVQGHMNIIAVAALREFSCIILADDAAIEEDVLQKATEEGIPVFSSHLPVYESAKALMEKGL